MSACFFRILTGRRQYCAVCVGMAGLLLATTIRRECPAAEGDVEKSERTLENLTRMSPTGVALDTRVDWLTDLKGGRWFVKLVDGSIMTIAKGQVCVSRDGGNNWESWPMFGSPRKDLESFGGGGLLLRSQRGAIIFVLMNQRGMKWGWNDAKNLPAPDARLTVWSVRSLDEGKSWVAATDASPSCETAAFSPRTAINGGKEVGDFRLSVLR